MLFLMCNTPVNCSFVHYNNHAWLAAPPITSVGLRLSDEQLRISVAHRLSCKACEPHTCGCGKVVDACGLHVLHGLSGKRPKTTATFTSERHHLACNEKGADSVSQTASGPASATRQTPRRHHKPAMVEGKAAGMGRHSPGYVCRRPRQQHSHGNRRCSQLCRHQQDQQIQPTICNSYLHSSGH